eukprot:3606961-Prymnesium_polylepis.1
MPTRETRRTRPRARASRAQGAYPGACGASRVRTAPSDTSGRARRRSSRRSSAWHTPRTFHEGRRLRAREGG